jgi:hypothetical protein
MFDVISEDWEKRTENKKQLVNVLSLYMNFKFLLLCYSDGSLKLNCSVKCFKMASKALKLF